MQKELIDEWQWVSRVEVVPIEILKINVRDYLHLIRYEGEAKEIRNKLYGKRDIMISVEGRIYGLSLLWREAEYNFALWEKVPDLDWEDAYREFLPKVIAAEEPIKYYAELMKFIALLRDGHTYVIPPSDITPPYAVPIQTSYIEGKHIITRLPEDCGVPPYSELLAVNGVSLTEYLEQKIYPYIWHEKLNGKFW